MPTFSESRFSPEASAKRSVVAVLPSAGATHEPPSSPVRSAKSSLPGQRKANRVYAASDEFKAVSSVVADRLLHHGISVFVKKLGFNARHRRFIRVHASVGVAVLPCAARNRRRMHGLNGLKRRLLAHGRA